MEKFSSRWWNLGKGIKDERETSWIVSKNKYENSSFEDKFSQGRENVNSQLKLFLNIIIGINDDYNMSRKMWIEDEKIKDALV